METTMQIESGKRYLTRRGEAVTVLSIDPLGTFPTEARLTADAAEWPVVIRVDSGQWRGLTSRLMADGHSQIIDGRPVDHDNDIVAKLSIG